MKKHLKAEERKKLICEAAKDVFLQKGFQNTTMEDLMHATGLSKGGLYYHYRNKEAIFFDLLDQGNMKRFKLSSDFYKKHKNLSREDLIVESVLLKMVDQNEYKSLYGMLLIEAKTNKKMESFRQKIVSQSLKSFEHFVNDVGFFELKVFLNEDFMMLIDSFVLASRYLDLKKMYTGQSNLLRNIIRDYLKEHLKN